MVFRSVIKNKVVLVRFPFDYLSATKVPPVVFLTDSIGSHDHVVLAFITSRTPVYPHETDLLLDSNHDDFSATGLRVTSTLRLHRLMTVSASLVLRELGELSSSMSASVDWKLRRLFGLSG